MKTVLFVCVHNAGRSQMAEALFNHETRERGLNFHAQSAGTIGGKSLNPSAVEVMEEIGVSMRGQQPKLLSQAMADSAQTIITMGCGVDAEACPAKFMLSEDWSLDDPAGQGIEAVRLIRDQIRSKVNDLITEMTASNA